jgi:ATP-dependent phosphoenolpyruvate carboxykinase
MYNTKRLLDSIFMGDFSVKTISNDRLFNMSLPEIAQLVNSNVFDNTSKTILSNSAMHRILNNKKSDLIKSNQLKEFCK